MVVADLFDDDLPTQELLREVFTVLYDRAPDAEEEEALWSLICAAVSHCPCPTRAAHYRTFISLSTATAHAEYVIADEDRVTSMTHTGDLFPHAGLCLEEVLHDWSHAGDIQDLAEEFLDAWREDSAGDIGDIVVEIRQCDRSVTLLA